MFKSHFVTLCCAAFWTSSPAVWCKLILSLTAWCDSTSAPRWQKRQGNYLSGAWVSELRWPEGAAGWQDGPIPWAMRGGFVCHLWPCWWNWPWRYHREACTSLIVLGLAWGHEKNTDTGKHTHITSTALSSQDQSIHILTRGNNIVHLQQTYASMSESHVTCPGHISPQKLNSNFSILQLYYYYYK